MNIKKYCRSFSILLALFLANGAIADTIPPDAVVKNTANEVLEILKSDKDIENGDMNKLGKLVEDKIAAKFDFDLMSKMVLGRGWGSASADQKERFITEFRSLLVRTYSSALSKYRNQTIEYKAFREQPEDTEVKVKTQIVQHGGPAIPLDYSMELVGDTWKVYDVSIEGISLVVSYHGQFAAEIRQNGIEGVILKLAEKNKHLHQSAS